MALSKKTKQTAVKTKLSKRNRQSETNNKEHNNTVV